MSTSEQLYNAIISCDCEAIKKITGSMNMTDIYKFCQADLFKISEQVPIPGINKIFEYETQEQKRKYGTQYFLSRVPHQKSVTEIDILLYMLSIGLEVDYICAFLKDRKFDSNAIIEDTDNIQQIMIDIKHSKYLPVDFIMNGPISLADFLQAVVKNGRRTVPFTVTVSELCWPKNTFAYQFIGHLCNKMIDSIPVKIVLPEHV